MENMPFIIIISSHLHLYVVAYFESPYYFRKYNCFTSRQFGNRKTVVQKQNQPEKSTYVRITDNIMYNKLNVPQL